MKSLLSSRPVLGFLFQDHETQAREAQGREAQGRRTPTPA
jgi:hypothetical protein